MVLIKKWALEYQLDNAISHYDKLTLSQNFTLFSVVNNLYQFTWRDV